VPGVGTTLQPLDRLGVVARQRVSVGATCTVVVVTVGAAAADTRTRARTRTATSIGSAAAIVDDGQMMSDESRMGVKKQLKLWAVISNYQWDKRIQYMAVAQPDNRVFVCVQNVSDIVAITKIVHVDYCQHLLGVLACLNRSARASMQSPSPKFAPR
jgi:hypothetical protein